MAEDNGRSHDPDNLTLRMLRTLDIKTDRVIREIQALKQHSVATNETLLAVRKDIANLDERIARSETRLELRDLQA